MKIPPMPTEKVLREFGPAFAIPKFETTEETLRAKLDTVLREVLALRQEVRDLRIQRSRGPILFGPQVEQAFKALP